MIDPALGQLFRLTQVRFRSNPPPPPTPPPAPRSPPRPPPPSPPPPAPPPPPPPPAAHRAPPAASRARLPTPRLPDPPLRTYSRYPLSPLFSFPCECWFRGEVPRSLCSRPSLFTRPCAC